MEGLHTHCISYEFLPAAAAIMSASSSIASDGTIQINVHYMCPATDVLRLTEPMAISIVTVNERSPLLCILFES